MLYNIIVVILVTYDDIHYDVIMCITNINFWRYFL